MLAQVETDTALHGVPITYRQEGRQYIVVPAGGRPGGRAVGRNANVQAATAELVAFGLPRED